MDLSASIDFDGFSANTVTRGAGGVPMSGYLVDEVDTSDVEIAAYAEKLALTDGIAASDVYLGRRRIRMIVSVFGSTKGDFWDKQQDLLSAFSPTLSFAADSANLGFRPLNFFQPTANISTWPVSTYPNGIPLRYYVRPAALPSYTIRRDDLGGVAGGGLSLRYSIQLTARDPRKVTQAESSSNVFNGYSGDYPVLADIVIVSGSATGDGSLSIAGNLLSVNIDAASTTYTFRSLGLQFYKGATQRDDLMYSNTTPFIFDEDHAGATTAGGVLNLITPGNGTYSYRWREAFA